jgi:T4 RnlA family RNA ligase
MFPSNLSILEHLRENPMIRFKRELVDGKEFEIVSYMIGDSTLWDIPGAIECRGHTFDSSTGKCVSAPFMKFFNVGERVDTQIPLVERNYFECLEKRDGSMITPVIINDHVHLKTKKSFYSEVAVVANQVCPQSVRDLSLASNRLNLTPIFEFNHPSYRIVLNYGNQPQFVLIAMRSNETGLFLPYRQVQEIAHHYDVKMIKRFDDMKWDNIMADIDNLTNFEGYVLLLNDGRRVKLKTRWYLSMHRTMTQLRVRDVAEMVVDETIDDCKSLLSSQGMDLTPVEIIEHQVIRELSSLRAGVEQLKASYQLAKLSIKDIALDLQERKEPLFSLVMTAMRDRDPDYVKYWKANYLKMYSLEGVYNSNF